MGYLAYRGNDPQAGWATVEVRPYTPELGRLFNDEASEGGVHIMQIRLNRTHWERRWIQEHNGWISHSRVAAIPREEAMRLFDRIRPRENRREHLAQHRIAV